MELVGPVEPRRSRIRLARTAAKTAKEKRTLVDVHVKGLLQPSHFSINSNLARLDDFRRVINEAVGDQNCLALDSSRSHLPVPSRREVIGRRTHPVASLRPSALSLLLLQLSFAIYINHALRESSPACCPSDPD